MIVARTVSEVRAAFDGLRNDSPGGGDRRLFGLVPTMGALHDGHRALVRAARADNDVVCVSVFVNPSQFAASEDLSRYPRPFEHDLAVLGEEGADVVFAPEPVEIYPPGFATWVEVEGASAGLEGDARPGHFRGVATVCLKLFTITRADRAYFGQKDAQQVAVIEQMVRDLNLELEIRVVPTVRDRDGLALSSRNAYLSPAERSAGLALPRAMAAGLEAYEDGADPEQAALAVLAREPRVIVDYVHAARLGRRLVLAGAVRSGTTRLIDNVVLEEEDPQ